METQLLKTKSYVRAEAAGSETEGKVLEARIYENFDELRPMQQEWDEFVESVGGEIFLTFDWCRIWWRYYGGKRRLRVFVFRFEGRLVGIVPVFFEKIWLGPAFLRTVKIVGTDFTPISVSIPIEKGFIGEVVGQFWNLLAEYNWDIVHMGPLAGLYKNFHELEDGCERLLGRGFKIRSKVNGVQTYFRLAGSWEEQFAGFKKREQKRIRRYYKACGEAGTLARVFASDGSFEQTFNNFARMHANNWKVTERGGHFEDWPLSHQFHREAAEVQLKRGRLRLLEVGLSGHCLGYKYGYKFGGKYFEYLDARAEPESIPFELPHISLGTIVFTEELKAALDGKSKWLDSMRGNYEHKLRLGGELFSVKSLYIYPKRIAVSLRVWLFRALVWVLDVAYYKIWFGRIRSKLGLKPKSLWKIWIRTYPFSF